MDRIPDDILELLRDRVASLEQLELLLLVHAEPARKWSLAETATRLSLPETFIEPDLDALVAAGLLGHEGSGAEARWRYAPRDTATAELTDRLATVYAARRLEIMRILSDLALSRMRGSAARAFADSFIIGRKKDG